MKTKFFLKSSLSLFVVILINHDGPIDRERCKKKKTRGLNHENNRKGSLIFIHFHFSKNARNVLGF